MQPKMRAMVYERYGEPDEVLEMREVDVPTIAEDEVLVRVRAVAVNPLDWHLMVGKPRIARLSFGLRAPSRAVPGNDIAGTVTAVGEAVTAFAPGDHVVGEAFGGGLADYVAVAEVGLVTKPANVTFEEAAAVPVAGLTALQGLRDWGGMEAGDDVLVIGASGGVGTFAVQVARALGASHITGVCSTRNVETAQSLGADDVVDYTKDQLAEVGREYDVIFDGPSSQPISVYRRLLKPDGVYVLIGGPKGDWLAPLPRLAVLRLLSLFGGMSVANSTAKRSQTDLATLRDWLESGQLESVIDSNYDLEGAARALMYQGTFHARGKIIVTVRDP